MNMHTQAVIHQQQHQLTTISSIEHESYLNSTTT